MKINLIFKNSDRFLLIVKKVRVLSVKEEVLVVLGISKGKIRIRSYLKDFMVVALEK